MPFVLRVPTDAGILVFLDQRQILTGYLYELIDIVNLQLLTDQGLLLRNLLFTFFASVLLAVYLHTSVVRDANVRKLFEPTIHRIGTYVGILCLHLVTLSLPCSISFTISFLSLSLYIRLGFNDSFTLIFARLTFF